MNSKLQQRLETTRQQLIQQAEIDANRGATSLSGHSTLHMEVVIEVLLDAMEDYVKAAREAQASAKALHDETMRDNEQKRKEAAIDRAEAVQERKEAAAVRLEVAKDRKDQWANRWIIVLLSVAMVLVSLLAAIRSKTTVSAPQVNPTINIPPQLPVQLPQIQPTIVFSPIIYVTASRPGTSPNKTPVWESSKDQKSQ
jgi:hypothetical protein